MNCCTDLMASRSALLPNYINFGTEEPLVSGSEVVQRGKFLPVGIFYRNMVVSEMVDQWVQVLDVKNTCSDDAADRINSSRIYDSIC